MTKTTKAGLKAELVNLVKIASGEEVNGVRLGQVGVTLEWLTEAVRARQEILEGKE